MNPLVSILIPAYNAEKWISDTIQSALAQTWPKTEIIIVDDGSIDNTLTIARAFESKSLKVITQTNQGGCRARNRAFVESQGDFIQWLDADDLLAPDKIILQLTNNDINPQTKILYSSTWGHFFYSTQKAKFNPDPLWHDLSPLDWLIKSFEGGFWMNPAVWLVSRSLTELAGPWDERLIINQDGEYFCRVVAASRLVKFNQNARSYYRKGSFGSISSNRSTKALENLFLSLDCCIDHLLTLENSETTRKACVNFLQYFNNIYQPEEPKIINSVHQRAIELGGIIAPPAKTWKFYVIRKVLGLNIAKQLKNWLWSAEIIVRKNMDRIFSVLFSNNTDRPRL